MNFYYLIPQNIRNSVLKDRFSHTDCIGNNANYKIDFKEIIIHAFILSAHGFMLDICHRND